MFFQASAILLLLIFYGCYFGKLLSQRRKGIRTDQLGRGKKGFVRLIELSVKAAAAAVPAAEVISIVLNVSGLPSPFRWAGLILALAGDVFFLCAVITMRDSWRAGVSGEEKTELVTSGVFSISRNPAFLGFDLVYLGMALTFFSWPLTLLSAFAALLLHLQIVNVEEDFLIAAFGQDYLDYRGRVCRYLGRKPRS